MHPSLSPSENNEWEGGKVPCQPPAFHPGLGGNPTFRILLPKARWLQASTYTLDACYRHGRRERERREEQRQRKAGITFFYHPPSLFFLLHVNLTHYTYKL